MNRPPALKLPPFNLIGAAHCAWVGLASPSSCGRRGSWSEWKKFWRGKGIHATFRLGLGRSALLGRWQKYGVDNVDYAVAAGDVGLGDVHVAIECYTTVGGYLQIGAVDRLRCFAV